MKRYTHITVVAISLLFGAGALSLALRPAQAAASLSITPITWNVIGLDSNNVSVGPNDFPVGARVCNIGDAPATNVTSAFVWDSANALVNLRPGTLTNFNASPVASLAPSACHDFYYEVEVTRNAAAYDTTRRYHITATADTIGTVSTPIPRELYVEHLISQSRNHVLDVKLNGTSVPNGGTMALVVGQTYTIELVGSTATNGYEQLESFINFPNTIFQVLSVSTTYSADSSANVSNPNDKLYGDGCKWENDPNSPYYRSCRDVGKIGGSVNVVYQVKILQAPSAPLTNPEPLSTLLYDFSGSSFHYNSDVGTSARFAAVIDPSTLTIAKNFNPDPTNVNGVSALTFTITNPNPAAVSGVSFSDTFPTSPGAMVVANPADGTINGCGAATFSPVAGAGSISFSNGTVAANSTCTVKVNVTVPATGTYTNTSNHLFVGGIDTGSFATDTLTVNNAPPPPSPVCGSTLALWTFPSGFNINAPAPTTNNVAGASASPGPGVTPLSATNSTTTADGTLSWGSNGNITPGTPLDTANDDYFQFAIDTTNQTSVTLSFDALHKAANGPQGLAVYTSTSTKATGATEPNPAVFSNDNALPTQNTWVTFSSITVNSGLNPSGLTYFRIYAYNSGNTNSGSDINLDNVHFTGCVTPSAPTISKGFSPSPVAVGGSSTLTFTITNPNGGIALSGIAFDDTLPAGVTVTSGSSTQCGGTLTRTAPSTLSFTGGTIAAGGSCTVTATVTVTTAGPHDNVSGFVSSTEGGTNTGTTGIATASITGILPPAIAKQFAPNPVLAGTATTLTFTLTNPNASLAQSGVAFTDTFPTSPGAMVVAPTPAATTSGCGSPTFAPSAGSGSVSFSGGTIAAGGTCIVTVNVVAPTAGSYANTSGAVSHIVNGSPVNGGTASDTLTVNPANPAIALLKQVGPTAAGPWSSFLAAPVGGNVFYRFTVENIGNVPLNSVGVTDPQVSTASCTWPSPLPVASPTADPTATCIVGPVSAVSGTHANTATASGTNGTTVTDTSTATYATTGLTLAKSATETSYTLAGDQLHYSYLVTNSGFAALAGPVTVSDNKATVTCPAVSTVGDLDNFLDPGESITCTATYTITAGDVTAGQVTNMASATADGATSNTASKTVPLSTSADVSLVKTLVTAGPYTAGQSISYTLVVANAGPATATNIQVTDTPTNLTITNVSGGGCAALPCTIPSLASGANTTINVTATINVAGAFDNSANATAAELDPNTANNTDNTGNGGTATAFPPSIAKAFSPNSILVGGVSTLSFTITNPNSGASLTGVAFTDTFPSGLQVAATPNATTSGCGSPTFAPAAGNTSLSFSGGTIAASGTCTVTVAVTATTSGSKVNTTGNVTSTNGGTGNTATDTLTVTPSADLSVSKTNSVSGVNAGGTTTYTLTLTNNGPSAANGATISDPAATGLAKTALGACTPSGGAVCPTAGAGAGQLNIANLEAGTVVVPTLPSGGSISFTVTATVTATSGSVTNTFTATVPAGTNDPTPGNNTASDTDTVTPVANLSITKNDGVTSVNANGTTTYTIVVTNGGPSSADNAVFTDPAATGLSVTNVTCGSASGGAVCPTAGNTTVALMQGAGIVIPTLPSGGSVTFTVSANVTATSGSVTNTAMIAPPSGTTDSDNSNNSASDTDTITPVADLSITKTDGTTTYVPGTSTTYTITVTNSGPSPVTNAPVTDTFPAAITSASWTCAASAGSSCATASSTGNISTTVSLLVNGTATFTVTANISASATGNLINTASVAAPSGAIDPTPGNNSATDTDTPTPQADLSITKTDGTAGYTPGTPTTYTIVATNNGPSAVTNALIADTFPAAITSASWTCMASAGSSCGSASGMGNINATANLAVNGTATFTVTAQISASATGNLDNTAMVTAPAGTTDPNLGNNSATDSDTNSAQADLSITKTDGTGTYTPGTSTTYTIVVSNSGPSSVNNASVVDNLPAGVASATWMCVASAGGNCDAANGTGSINTTVDLAPGATTTFTVVAQISPSATGNLVNTATVTAPPGVADSNSGNNSATDTDTPTPQADLAITKTDNSATYTPGGQTVYSIVVTNNGPSAVTNAPVADTFPAAITSTSWTCVASVGSSCGAANGTGNIASSVSLLPGGNATYTVTAMISAGASGNLVNTATVTAPAGTTDTNGGNNSATDTDTPMPSADLSVTKTDNQAVYTAGSNVVYTIVVTNNGPSNITGATVTDTLPAGQVNVAGASWTCAASAGSSCGAASGTGNIATTVNLLVGGTATYTYTVPVLAGASGNLSNTVNVAPPAGATDPNSNNNSATDTDTANPQSDLSITKVSASPSYVPGGTVVWTIVVTNNGPSTVNGATVTDLFPAVVTAASWTCTASAGSNCMLPSGNGNINTTVNLLTSGTATFTVTAQISPTATGNLSNTATVTPPAGVTDAIPSNNSATEVDTPAPSADLRINKTDNSATYVPGGTTTYIIVVTNDGPSAVTGAQVADSLPASITSANWTCAASAGSSCGTPSGTGAISTTVNLLPTGTATFTMVAQISPSATGNLSNTATVTAPAGTTDPTPGNNSATDTDTPLPQADLSITKTDGSSTAVPGQTVTYTIVTTNNGPSNVTGATVTDTLPASLSGATWTCAASIGSSCAAGSGTGNISTTVNLLVNGTATFTLTATISATATGNLANTASVAAPAGTTDPTNGNNSATDTDTLTPQADLSITKTDGATTYTPGTTVTYTIVATNNGPSAVTNALITDTLPVAITSASWTCVASAGSSCGSANGTGNINATATLAVNGTATFTVTAQVSPAATGNLVNTANAAPPAGTADPNQGNNSATDTDTINAQADLTIAKSDGTGTYTPGTSTTYTIVVTNNGPSSVNNAAVIDNLPVGISSAIWTCVASAGGNCDAANGTGSINTTVDLGPGATTTFTVVAQISPSATGNLVNTATVAVPPGVTDPTPSNNTATDTDTANPQADLAITKTDNVVAATPGGQTVYTIVVTNNGPSAVTGATVNDTLPAAITSATWTCAGGGGASCPNASGTGSINQTVNLPVGGSLTYTVTAQISPGATGNLVNTATVTAPAGTTDPTLGNNTATDTDTLGPAADVVVQKNGTSLVQTNGTVRYTVEVTNLGPSSANGTTFTDTLPSGLTGVTASCGSAVAGAVCPGSLTIGAGSVTGTILTLPPGGSLVITITGTAPSTIGMLVNEASATVPAGVLDPNPGNNSSSVSTQVVNTPIPAVANLAVTKVGTSTVQTNGTIIYVVTVTNAGPGAANGATFSDTVPAAITGVTWTCLAAGGAICPNANGSGNAINQTIATLPANGQLIYTINGTAPASAQSLTNTASITAPAGVTDPDTSDNTASQPTQVTTTPPTSADLVIAKTGPANVAANGQMTYTITVTNAGPAAADGAVVTDNLPNVLSNVTATCSATGGAVCGATSVGAGNVLTGAITKLPVWGIVTYTVTATAPATGSFANSATVTPPVGVNDPDPSDNTGGVVITTVGPTVADLAITKTNNTNTVVAGSTTTYTVVVTNNGPTAVTNAAVNDNLPAGLVNATWTCTATAGSSCTSASGTGSINTNVTLLDNGVATFTVTAMVLPTATGTLSNTATVTAPPGVTDPDLTNNTASDGPDVIQQVADLSILKTDNTGIYTPGGQTNYTIVVVNHGPSAVTNATVTDTLPAALTNATWTCSATVGSSCGAPSGNGSIASTVSLLPGGQATYTLHALISPSATGNLVNTATVTAPVGVTDPTPGNNSSTDTDTPNAVADLAISKSNNALTVTPGGTTTYTIVVTNNGPSAVTGATVNDTLPAALTNASWTCTATTGSSCGAASGTGNIATTVNLVPGGQATFTLTATVAVGQTADVANTATVTPPAGVTDPNLTNNTKTDVDKVQPQADLAITKTNGVTSVVPGGTTTYTIVVTNNGPSAVTNAQVLDVLPASISSATWTCTASAGSSCGAAAGSGTINTTVNLLPNGTATFMVIAQISPTATGILTNLARVIAPQGVIDPNTSNNVAADSDPLAPQGNLSITKTDGVTSVTTGGMVTYTIVATNSGPSTATGAQVVDNVSASLTNVTWTCVASAGSLCGAPNGTGSIGTSVTLASGGTATFTLKGTVAANASGNLVNTATITAPNGFTDTNPADNSATDTDTVTQQADLSILKTNFTSSVAPGGQTQYTIVVTNNGPSNVTGATVTDTLPASLGSATWTCVASPGSSCAATNGSGNIATTVNLLSGGTATFLLNATVSQSASGTVANTATVATPVGVTDPTPSNNTSTDTDTVQATADLSITKTVSTQTVQAGGSLSYTITVRNNGPSNVTGAQVSDVFSNKLTNISWTCTPSGGSSCGAASGTGNIATTVNLLANGSATFVVAATVSPTATGAIENTASVTAPIGTTDPNTSNNVAAPVVTVIVAGVDLGISKSHTGNFQVGQSGNYKITVENVSQFPTTGAITVTDTLPNGLVYQSGTGQGWTCGAAGQMVTCTRNAPLQSGAISEITLKVFVTSAAFPSVTNTATVSTPGDANAANNTASDPTVVENGLSVQGIPYPATSPISDQKAGSILVFPVHTSDAVNGNTQNTRIAITNIDPVRSIAVHLFFVDGLSCAVSDSFVCLTAQQTTTFLASDVDPGTTGYIVAVAVNNEGCPIIFNQLIGDEYVKFASGHQANLGAEAIAALPGLLNQPCTLNSGSLTLSFNGVMYNALPRVLADDSIGSRADGNDTMLIVDRIGGDLGVGGSTLGTLFGLLYDDTEVGVSFSFSGGCQLRGSLSNNFPRTSPRFEQFIPAGRTGWMKIYSQNDGAVGILGAAIRFNPNATASAGAFNQGHNLHKLTLTTEATVTIPVFPPSCQ